MEMKVGATTSNKQIVLRDYVSGFPEESDFLITSTTIDLKVPAKPMTVLVKNLYLSCDPYLRNLMKKPDSSSPAPHLLFNPGKVYIWLAFFIKIIVR